MISVPSCSPGQRQRGRDGTGRTRGRRARRRPRARGPARRRSLPTGWSSARQSAAPPPVARIVARAADRPGVGDHARRRPSPSLQSASADVPSRTSIAGSAATSAERRSVSARPVSLPPAWTIRRAVCPPSRPSASSPSGPRCRTARRSQEPIHRGRAPPRRAPAPRRAATEPAAGGERVGGVAVGRVVGRQARPRARPAPSSWSSPGVACARRGPRARPPRRPGRGVEPGGAAADDHHLRRCLIRPRSTARYRTRRALASGDALTLYYRHPAFARAPHRGPSGESGADPGDRGRARGGGLAGPRAAGAAARPRASSSSASTRRPRRRDRGVLRGGRRDDRHGHGRLARAPGRRRSAPPGRPATRSTALLAGEERAAFCGLRPPGHHAERDRAMGFCLFNNVAVAAAHAIAAARRRAGARSSTGTSITATAPRRSSRRRDEVLYASIHQWPLYPGHRRRRLRGRGSGGGVHDQPAGPAGRGLGAVPRARRSTSWPRCARVPPRPDRDLGRVRRAPRGSAGRRASSTRRATGRWRRRMRGVAAELGAPCWSASRAATTRARWPLRARDARGARGDEVPELAPAELAEPHRARVAGRWGL